MILNAILRSKLPLEIKNNVCGAFSFRNKTKIKRNEKEKEKLI